MEKVWTRSLIYIQYISSSTQCITVTRKTLVVGSGRGVSNTFSHVRDPLPALHGNLPLTEKTSSTGAANHQSPPITRAAIKGNLDTHSVCEHTEPSRYVTDMLLAFLQCATDFCSYCSSCFPSKIPSVTPPLCKPSSMISGGFLMTVLLRLSQALCPWAWLLPVINFNVWLVDYWRVSHVLISDGERSTGPYLSSEVGKGKTN